MAPFDWRALRQRTNERVHETFQRPAEYHFKSGVASVSVWVRLHTDYEWLGDDGLSELPVLATVALVSRDDVAAPVRGDKIEFADLAKTYTVEVVVPDDESHWRMKIK